MTPVACFQCGHCKFVFRREKDALKCERLDAVILSTAHLDNDSLTKGELRKLRTALYASEALMASVETDRVAGSIYKLSGKKSTMTLLIGLLSLTMKKQRVASKRKRGTRAS